MPRIRHDGSERGFTLIELAIVLVLSAALVGLIALLGGESRRQGRLGEDIAKLQRIGSWTASYAADNQDQFWTFSWKRGVAYQAPVGGTWPIAQTDMQAAANQAADLLQRAGRPDVQAPFAWLPHVSYSHLVMQSYGSADFPDLTFVSTGDRHRLLWARDPQGFENGKYVPSPWNGTPGAKRWPYSASFQLPPAFFDRSPVQWRVSQGSTHTTYFIPSQHDFSGRVASEVLVQSQKVLLHDYAAWHFGPRASHFAYPELRMPLLFCDGSVRVRSAGEANPGWRPNSPTSPEPTPHTYQPDQWEPGTLSGEPVEIIAAGRFRWTRGGIAGRDFGGPEVCTGQPGCP